MTPLGSPVLPLEKMMVARESRGEFKVSSFELKVGELRLRSTILTGRQARRPVLIFSAKVGLAAICSRKIGSKGSLSFTFSRNVFEVRTVLMSHWRMQEERVSSARV